MRSLWLGHCERSVAIYNILKPMLNNLDTSITPTWCPGCGNFGIWAALKLAIEKSAIPLKDLVIVYDIGCAGNMNSFLSVYGFHGLHGRAIPAAAGIILANPKLKVIVVTGDGGLLGEGLTHFIHACRANLDLTVLLHNNQMYSLTTGQSSPTSMLGTKGKATPQGVTDKPLVPISMAILAGATYTARAFAPDIPQTEGLITAAINHPGFSLVEVLQPCVTYNKLNTATWFKERLEPLQKLPSTDIEAIDLATWSDTTIYTGVFKQTSG
mgnify:CR=1 FL=1